MNKFNSEFDGSTLLYNPKYISNNREFQKENKLLSTKNKLVNNGVVKGQDLEVGDYEPLDTRKDRDDPYLSYLNHTGNLIKSSRVSQVIRYIDINSKFRNTEPYLSVEQEVFLDDNPITFTNGSKTLTFSYENHNLSIGDRIVINGVETNFIKLRTKIDGVNTFEFVENSQYLIINYQHNISSLYNDTYIKVSIDGISSDTVNGLIGNIHINSINKTHIVYLTKPKEDLVGAQEFDENRFFIKLPKKFVGTFTLPTYNFRIKFNSIYGIPLNLINANYPISYDNFLGFHIITNTTQNSFSISVFKNSIISTSTATGGGTNISIGKINKIIDGFPNANNYTISLPFTINNITSIRMVSSEFPGKVRSITSNNNKIYWQNLEDGDKVFEISIPSGNYDIPGLTSELEYQFSLIDRENVIGSYDTKHNFSVDINEYTNSVSFKAFKKAIISEPILSVIPDISLEPSNDGFDAGTEFEIIINHPNHQLFEGEEIIITNAIGHLGISESVLNSTHIIREVIDENTYKIKLPQLNLSTDRYDTSGGDTVEILVPSLFRLRFDFSDTLGNILGFRNVGESYAITPYAIENKNTNAYENDITLDELGNEIEITNNFIKLKGDDYILVRLRNIENISSLGKIKDIFGKIQLSDSYENSTVFNSFIDCKKIFEVPINKLNELHFEFYTPDGDFVDFAGLEHSFTLEFTYIVETPKGTGVQDNTSRNINQDERPLDSY